MTKNHHSAKSSFKGIYVLIIQVDEDIELKVGALGKISFTKGSYAYVGSAQANIEQRIKRHLKSEKRKFWHVDYLLGNSRVKILKVFFKKGDNTEECKTAEGLGEKGEPIASFGCSDCKCESHLFHIKNYEFLQDTMQVFPKET